MLIDIGAVTGVVSDKPTTFSRGLFATNDGEIRQMMEAGSLLALRWLPPHL
jgi:hypothetical protein